MVSCLTELLKVAVNRDVNVKVTKVILLIIYGFSQTCMQCTILVFIKRGQVKKMEIFNWIPFWMIERHSFMKNCNDWCQKQ